MTTDREGSFPVGARVCSILNPKSRGTVVGAHRVDGSVSVRWDGYEKSERWAVHALRPALEQERPRLFDVACCAGGASKGFHRAGWDVTGTDIDPQPNYPYKFIQADLRDLDPDWLAANFDAASASVPCQFYSGMTTCRPGVAATYPDLIGRVRDLFEASGLPYVIENVVGARSYMRDPVMLCGFMFGRELYRHRLFETNWPLVQPEHPEHTIPASKAGHWVPGTVMSVAGHVAPIAKAREVMEIDWTTRAELAEAIPPYYTEYVGEQLLSVLAKREAA